MDQNSYARQLIVLRGVIDGYSGHARLTRGASGTRLELRLQSPAGEKRLYAVIVTRDESGYNAEFLGEVFADDRGHASPSFALSAIPASGALLTVVEQKDAQCRLALSGFLGAQRAVNWATVRAAACEAVAGRATPPASAVLPEPEAPAEAEPIPDASEPVPAEAASEAPSGSVLPEVRAAPEAPARTPTAAEAAGADPNAVWPEEIAMLRPFFEARQPAEPYPDSRYTFVYVPKTTVQPALYAGIVTESGVPVRAAYAVPGDGPDVRPQGMEEFSWIGGGEDGYWVIFIDAATGMPVPGADR